MLRTFLIGFSFLASSGCQELCEAIEERAAAPLPAPTAEEFAQYKQNYLATLDRPAEAPVDAGEGGRRQLGGR